MDKSIAQVASHSKLYIFHPRVEFFFLMGGGAVLFLKGNTHALCPKATIYKSLLKTVSASTVTPPTSFHWYHQLKIFKEAVSTCLLHFMFLPFPFFLLQKSQ